MIIRFVRSLCTLLLLFFFFESCKKEARENPAPPPVTPGSVSVSGTVVNEQNTPLAGVSIHAGSLVTVSDNNGKFSLRNVSATDSRVVLTAEKTGYFKTTSAGTPAKEGAAQFKLMMTERKVVASFDAGAGATGATGGSTVKIPANGVVNKDGSAYNGTVQMAARYISPESSSLGLTMPGGDFQAVNKNQQSVSLYTYGAVEVELQSATGAPLQLKTGSEATLSLPIAASQAASAPASIPLWFFDTEKNKWVEEGTATRQGNRYVGNVKHFTAWNADMPEETATVEGKIKTCDGKGIPFVSLRVGQLMVVTDETGFYSTPVQANTVQRCGVLIVDAAGTRTDSFSIAPVAAKTTKVADYQVKCEEAILKGQVVSPQNVPVKAKVLLRGSNETRLVDTDDQGRFAIGLPGNVRLTVEASANSQSAPAVTVTTPVSGTLDLGQLKLTSATQSTSTVSFTLNGAGFVNKQINMVSVYDPNEEEGIYQVSTNLTVLLKVVDDYLFSAQFTGRQPGVYNGAFIYVRLPDNKGLSLPSGAITVTKYEAVGGTIEGRFSGTFVYFNEVTGQPLGNVTLTNGSFVLHHSADAP